MSGQVKASFLVEGGVQPSEHQHFKHTWPKPQATQATVIKHLVRLGNLQGFTHPQSLGLGAQLKLLEKNENTCSGKEIWAEGVAQPHSM